MLKKYRLAPANDLDRLLNLLHEGIEKPHRLHVLQSQLSYYIGRLPDHLRDDLTRFRKSLEEARIDKVRRARIAHDLNRWQERNYPAHS